MRIITGLLKGRKFESPHSRRTHPMSDRVRGALFNSLGDISGLSMFDPFGGTGALAFEAVSRGASEVVICEIDKRAQQTIAANIEQLKLESVTLYRGNAKAWLRRNPDQRFDVILADPPYDDIDPIVLEVSAARTTDNGIFVLSWPGKEKPLHFDGFRLVHSNSYGDAQLFFFKRH